MFKPTIAVGVTLTLIAGQPAAARNFGEHGGYDVSAIETMSKEDRGYCGMMEEFAGPGETRLMLFRHIENPDLISVSIDNYNWSAKESETYPDFKFEFDDLVYDRDVTGVANGIHKGFLTAFPASEFLPVFRRSTSLHVFKGDVEIDRLDLQGSAAATDGFAKCWAYLVADDRAKEREWKKWEDLPLDPFKPEASQAAH